MDEKLREELDKINRSKQLSEVQLHMMDMIKVMVQILDENHIPYYIIGGTLLGAVRHNGFIPWDDDLDIAIPRAYYDAYLSLCREKLPSHLKLRTYDDDSYHHYYFSRVVDTRYFIKRLGSLKERNEELWIDIFPLDGLSDNIFVRQIQKMKLLTYKVMYHFASFDKVNINRPNRPKSQKIIINLYMKSPFKVKKDSRYYLDKIDAVLRNCSAKKSKYLMNFMGSTIPFKETMEEKYWGKGKKYPFEDMELMGPDDGIHYLELMYGDYMQLPPEDKRNYHAAEFIKNESI